MKQIIKSMILLLMVLVCGQGMANGAIQEKNIWKIFPIGKKAVLISDDYEVWLLHGLQSNELTWSELIWREKVPQPDPCYFFDVEKWEVGQTISIAYFPWQDCEWKDTYRNDASLLQYCDFAIQNDAYDARVFAKTLRIDEWTALYTDLRKEVLDLADRGFHGHAAELLEQELVFAHFMEKVINEWVNKTEGKPFDGQYVIFGEKYGLF